MSVSVNYTSFTKTREGNKTCQALGGVHTAASRAARTPPTSSAAGRPRPGVFSEGLAEGQEPVPWVGNVRGGKRPHAWADVGGEVKGKELQAAGGGSGHTLAARSVEELDLEGKQRRARL